MVVGIEILRLDTRIPYTDLTTRFHVHSEYVRYLEVMLPSVQVRMQIASDGVNSIAPQMATQLTNAQHSPEPQAPTRFKWICRGFSQQCVSLARTRCRSEVRRLPLARRTVGRAAV